MAPFTELDTASRDDIAQLRERQRDGITDAHVALNLLPSGAVAISVLPALALCGSRCRTTTERVPLMRTTAAILLLASLLVAGCAQVQPLREVSALQTTLPLPSGAEIAPSVSGAAVERDATALGPNRTAIESGALRRSLG